MNTEVEIREAQPGDAAGLAGLMVELGYPTTEKEMRERLKSISTDREFRTFVAVSGNRVCGMIGTVAQPSYEHNDRGGRILALVVSKNARRQGIARKLIAAAEKDFAQREITRIAVNTRLSRKEAHKFYGSAGYEKNGWRFVKLLPSHTK